MLNNNNNLDDDFPFANELDVDRQSKHEQRSFVGAHCHLCTHLGIFIFFIVFQTCKSNTKKNNNHREKQNLNAPTKKETEKVTRPEKQEREFFFISAPFHLKQNEKKKFQTNKKITFLQCLEHRFRKEETVAQLTALFLIKVNQIQLLRFSIHRTYSNSSTLHG